ncbi:hypothetical protein FF38_06836 [Lucilia cuprina]|uniref:Fringe-like glycosyltransferase domain-containing protein n=1 Tax=Lucilia cuprina TaxID=7375 RepID=A0A0L0CQ73_LUCCU|nr:3-glucosyltransferase, Beta-1 [Lucilia cuprina]KNC33594.1 hypothetical protein FF38_06836 [Lucilia cuprina]
MNLIHCIMVFILTAFAIAKAPPIDVVFFVQSQDTKYYNELSRNLKENIIKQSIELQPNYRIKVHVLHELFNYPGDWTIHNVIPKLVLLHKNMNTKMSKTTNNNQQMEIISDNTRWVVFCEDQTHVQLKLLMEKLNDENHTQPLYLGHTLYDNEPTIIHHFAFFENPKWFKYPMLRSGVVFSMSLFKSIADIYENHNNKRQLQNSEFSIDAAHELSRFIYNNIKISTTFTTMKSKINKNKTRTTTSSNDSDLPHTDFHMTPINANLDNYKSRINIQKQKIILKKASYICPEATWETGSKQNNNNKVYNDNEKCAMYGEQTTNAALSITCLPVKREEIYFAVKTCSKYHHERLTIIQNTWAQYVKHVKYFSDLQDDTIPTTNTGIPNVEMGHCAKTLQILKLALRDIENYNNKQHRLHQVNQAKYENHQIQWLFLTDDDTLLSVSGVCQVLGCYNSMDEIYLGERYGYRLYAEDGFNYITGGGGIAFSLPVVKLILQHCSCPSATAPDDMILGSCLHSLQLKALHSPRFHQARPNDYPLELLQQVPPVSFHKFWQLDPIEVYNQWFAAEDHQLLAMENHVHKNLIDLEYSSKSRRLLAKTEPLNLNEIPVSLESSLYHSKEHHIDL